MNQNNNKQPTTSIDPRPGSSVASAPVQTPPSATKPQLTWPLDPVTQSVLTRFILSLFTIFTTTGGAAGNTFSNVLMKLGNRGFAWNIYTDLILCTADATTDKFTLGNDLVNGGQGFLADDTFVTVFSPNPGDTPGGITNGFGYFVVNATANTVQLAASKGGAPIDLTTNGTGPQYIAF